MLRLIGIAHKDKKHANLWYGWHRARWKIILESGCGPYWEERCAACDRRRMLYL